MAWLNKLRQGLRKSGQALSRSLQNVFASNADTETLLEDVYDILIQNDLGIEMAEVAMEQVRKQKPQNAEQITTLLADCFEELLIPYAQPFTIPASDKPHVVLMTGVNGSGKTTTIAKLTKQCLEQNKRVAWAACDTFRAAATEQLAVWGERLNVPVYQRSENITDSAAIVFKALQDAQAQHYDVLFVDTAGRLQNNTPLMQELGKLVRVMRKLDETAPHQSIIVLDGTTGHNSFSQVDNFGRFVPLTGCIVTKLDGTAKAGFVLALCKKKQLPILGIGVGEQMDDLNTMDPRVFAETLAGKEA